MLFNILKVLAIGIFGMLLFWLVRADKGKKYPGFLRIFQFASTEDYVRRHGKRPPF